MRVPARTAVRGLALTAALLTLEAVPFAPAHAASAAGAGLHASDVLKDIRYLSSDKLEGRLTGEPGSEMAMRYIAERFARAGIVPAGDSGTYFQYFQATVGVRLGDGNTLAISAGGADSTFHVTDDFLPFAFSDTGTVDAPVVFAGYGITAPDLHYDDYAGLDATGTIVLILRHEPRENDSTSVFNGRAMSQYADFRMKLMTARQHGAAGVLVVTDPLNHAGDDDDLVTLGSAEGFGGGDVPAAHTKRRIGEWMARAAGADLLTLQTAIDSTMTPHSAALAGVRAALHIALVKDRGRVTNIAGILRGAYPV